MTNETKKYFCRACGQEYYYEVAKALMTNQLNQGRLNERKEAFHPELFDCIGCENHFITFSFKDKYPSPKPCEVISNTLPTQVVNIKDLSEIILKSKTTFVNNDFNEFKKNLELLIKTVDEMNKLLKDFYEFLVNSNKPV